MDFAHLQLLLAKKRTTHESIVLPACQVRQFYRSDVQIATNPAAAAAYKHLHRPSIEREVHQSLPPPPNIFANPPASPSPISDRSITLTNSFHSLAAPPASGYHTQYQAQSTDHNNHHLEQATAEQQQQQELSSAKKSVSQYRHSSSSIDHKTLSLTSFEHSKSRRRHLGKTTDLNNIAANAYRHNLQLVQLPSGLEGRQQKDTGKKRSNSFQQSLENRSRTNFELATKRLSVGQSPQWDFPPR